MFVSCARGALSALGGRRVSRTAFEYELGDVSLLELKQASGFGYYAQYDSRKGKGHFIVLPAEDWLEFRSGNPEDEDRQSTKISKLVSSAKFDVDTDALQPVGARVHTRQDVERLVHTSATLRVRPPPAHVPT